jgi:hypothetical protein
VGALLKNRRRLLVLSTLVRPFLPGMVPLLVVPRINYLAGAYRFKVPWDYYIFRILYYIISIPPRNESFFLSGSNLPYSSLIDI